MKKKITQLKEITQSNFSKLRNKHDWMVCMFYTDICPSCKTVEPLLLRLQKKYGGNGADIVFGKCNGQSHQQLSRLYQIMHVPTILVFQRGNGLPIHVQPERLAEKLSEVI